MDAALVAKQLFFGEPGRAESAPTVYPKALDIDFLDKYKQKSATAKKSEKKKGAKPTLLIEDEIITDERTTNNGLVLKPSRVIFNYKKSVAFISPTPGGLPGPRNIQTALLSMHRQASNDELESQMLAYDESYFKNYIMIKRDIFYLLIMK